MPSVSAQQHSLPGILVTAVSRNHFAQLHGLVHTAQNHLPQHWRIVVYDLIGDVPAADVHNVGSWCGVEYRRFNQSSVPPTTWFPKYLTLSVWKPIIIRDCLRELPQNGLVFYADTSTRFHEPLTNDLLEAARRTGFVGRQTASPVAMYTHPQMAVELARLRRPAHQTRGGSSDVLVDASTANLSTRYKNAPMVCGCISLWAHTPTVMQQLIAPWVECVSMRDCILPTGADGQDNHIGLSKTCRPGLEGHCHRGDQSALSIILYEAYNAHSTQAAEYLRNTEVSAETWKMCRAKLHGTLVTTERASSKSGAIMLATDPTCSRGNISGERQERHGPGDTPSHQQGVGSIAKSYGVSTSANSDCSRLTLTRVAVPTGVQPIFNGMGGPGASLRRLLKPCATEHACTVGLDGCFWTHPRAAAIGRCNSTHGVEYEHRLPDDGEPAIVSFFNPSAASVRDALAAVANARPRLYLEFEPPVHARVPQQTVLRGVDGQMTYARRALVQYPYFTAKQIWSAALNIDSTRGFEKRLPAIAVFVSNCRGHRAEAIDWLRQRFEVHSYGACKHGGNLTGIETSRRQRIEGGHFPECLHYRAILAIENNACEDYVSEKLLEAVRCGAVPIVRTFKGLPDYAGLFGPFPVLDAEKLDVAFEARLRDVLTNREAWEKYIPALTPRQAPDANVLAALTPRNPHCQLIEAVSRFRDASIAQAPLTQIRCETWYKVLTPHGAQTLPRRPRNATSR